MHIHAHGYVLLLLIVKLFSYPRIFFTNNHNYSMRAIIVKFVFHVGVKGASSLLAIIIISLMLHVCYLPPVLCGFPHTPRPPPLPRPPGLISVHSEIEIHIFNSINFIRR